MNLHQLPDNCCLFIVRQLIIARRKENKAAIHVDT